MYGCKYSNRCLGQQDVVFIEATHISGYVDSYMYNYMKEFH